MRARPALRSTDPARERLVSAAAVHPQEVGDVEGGPGLLGCEEGVKGVVDWRGRRRPRGSRGPAVLVLLRFMPGA